MSTTTMSTTSQTQPPPTSGVRRPDRLARLARRAVGGLYLVGAGVHVGIVAADTELYRRFADGAPPWIRTAWRDVFMAHPTGWGLAVAAGELAIGTAILVGGRWIRPGLLAAIGFHVALMLFGFGFWAWSVPMLVLLVALWRAAAGHATHPSTPS